MKTYEVRHARCNSMIGYMTEDSRNSVCYCKKCKENYIVGKIFCSNKFNFKIKNVEIANIKEPEPEPINKYVNFESQSQSHLVSYAQ